MVLQNTLRSDVSAILKSIHVIRAYLSIIASRPTNSRTISADMDGFQDGGYIWAQSVLQYHLIKVPWSSVNQIADPGDLVRSEYVF